MRTQKSTIVGVMGAGLALIALGSPLFASANQPARSTSPAATNSQAQAAVPSAVPAYAPAASRAEADVVDAARLLGIPLVRTARFPSASPVAFFSAAALADR